MTRPAIYTALALCFLSQASFAQRDTTRTQSVDITSAYKPVLRNAVKINFSGSHLPVDTSRPALRYNVPSQNLFYAYQPVALRPLALQMDSSMNLGDRRYVKAGFGTYSSPYLEAGFSFGDGRTSLLNLYGDYISAKGDIKHQDFSRLNVKALGSYFVANHEIYGGVALENHRYNLYGYDHNEHDYNKDDVKQNFEDLTFRVGVKNTSLNKLRINYDPSVELNFFSLDGKASESTVAFSVPASRKFGEDFTFGAEFRGQFTNYRLLGDPSFRMNNNLIHLAPYLTWSKPMITVHAGLKPTWNNGDVSLLPDIHFEAKLKDRVLMVQGGYQGRFVANTLNRLSSINPFLAPPAFINNTREVEFFGGIKASVGKHFSFSAKAGMINYENVPVFINDTATDNKAFIVTNETNLNNFRLQGDISYINQDKFTLNAALTLNGYTGMEVHEHAWNMVPMEVRTSVRWWAFKQLMVKGDLYLFGGGDALDKGNTTVPFDGGTDLSAGLEYRINKNFGAWLNFNNILNDKYERWKNYEVYGMNVMGGIRVNF